MLVCYPLLVSIQTLDHETTYYTKSESALSLDEL